MTRPSGFQRHLWLWDVYFAVVCASVVVSLAVDHTTTRRGPAFAALGAQVALYLVVGRGLIRTGGRLASSAEKDSWLRSGLFVAGLVGLFLVALGFASSVGFLLFAICPLVLLTLPLRTAIAVAVLADLLPVAVTWWRDGVTTRLVEHLLPISAVSIALSVWLGVWINQVITQSEERADLIGQLERSRAEVARLSHEAGIAAERTRLAGEIHDTLAQGFTSIVTLLQAADSELDRDLDKARGRLGLAVRTARENLAESRALVAALAPSALDSATLAQSLRQQADRLAEETTVAATYVTEGTARSLPTAVEVVLLRTAQEALANVRKHARADRVTVRLEYGPAVVRLTVRDDGVGFDPAGPSHGYGLAGMRARVDQVSGVLTIHSGANVGTTVVLEVAG